jgi:ribosomal protein S18 acetylase RimI-like enzyme
MFIRPAAITDAQRIAQIHVAAWQAAYQQIFPASFLNNLSVENRFQSWQQELSGGKSNVLVVETDAEVVGWVAFGNDRDTPEKTDTSEIYALYIMPGFWFRGAGKSLVSQVMAHPSNSRISTLTVWALDENKAGIRFYESLNFSRFAEKTIQRAGLDLKEIKMRMPVPDIAHS